MPERDDSRGRKPDDKGQPETHVSGPAVHMSGLDRPIRYEDDTKPSGPRNVSETRRTDK